VVKAGGTQTAIYLYNGSGERVRRIAGGQTTLTLYGDAGQWLGDYDATGQPLQQAIWFGDPGSSPGQALPVGLLTGAGANQKLHYVQADALGTPRVVIDPARNVAVWRWALESEAFGESAPEQDPDNDGTAFVLDIRFPGQRYDAASGLHYNYFRDYDPATGRYAQSDPIGLAGGVGAYVYVSGDPLREIDSLGLAAEAIWFERNGNGTFYQSALNYKSPRGTFTIATHGILGTLMVRGPDGRHVGGKRVWELIRDQYRRGGYKRIRIAACEAGLSVDGARSFASDLAGWSGQTVEATPFPIGYPLNGKLFIGDYLPNSTSKVVPRPNENWRIYDSRAK
jgi:RHS repeat-associated protein